MFLNVLIALLVSCRGLMIFLDLHFFSFFCDLRQQSDKFESKSSHCGEARSLLYSLWKRKYVGSTNMRLLEVVVKAVLWFINTAAKVSALTTARGGFLLCITELRLVLMF